MFGVCDTVLGGNHRESEIRSGDDGTPTTTKDFQLTACDYCCLALSSTPASLIAPVSCTSCLPASVLSASNIQLNLCITLGRRWLSLALPGSLVTVACLCYYEGGNLDVKEMKIIFEMIKVNSVLVVARIRD